MLFFYDDNFHSNYQFWAKRETYKGFLSLWVKGGEVSIMPQINTLEPQIYTVDFAHRDFGTVATIQLIGKFAQTYSKLPSVSYDPNINKINFNFERELLNPKQVKEGHSIWNFIDSKANRYESNTHLGLRFRLINGKVVSTNNF